MNLGSSFWDYRYSNFVFMWILNVVGWLSWITKFVMGFIVSDIMPGFLCSSLSTGSILEQVFDEVMMSLAILWSG